MNADDADLICVIRGSFQWERFSPDVLYTGNVQALRCPTLDKFNQQAIDAIVIFESTETVRAMRHDDVNTIR